jgi:uncharacterized protein YyaL (SSP411 family)
MERESFEDPAIATLMNDLFVNVKVDREERPDVDDVYMKAVQMLTGRGGWPMTVFLTPDGEPFYGGTYFPPADRHGLPGFQRVLDGVARAWRERPDDVARSVDQLRTGLARMEAVEPTDGVLDPTLPRRAAEALLQHVDMDQGGLGGAPKFPHAPAFQLFLRQHRATGRQDLLDAVRLTCTRMANGGMYDQIGGGFHRYSVDARWFVPHFEKMLYDNAQIPRLYLEAWQVTRDPAQRVVVEDTLDYVLRDMRHPEGAFFSATDADSEGEEGKYFVWTPDEVRGVVDPADVDLVCRYWDISPEGNFEGKSIAHVTVDVAQVARMFGRTPADAAAAIARARAALRTARGRRVPPLRDEKILAGWNGLMIGTLAEAGRVLRLPRFVDAAAAAMDFLWTRLDADRRLLHGWTADRPGPPAYLDDHAFLAGALLDLFEATRDRRHLTRAETLAAAMDARFHDDAGGGYFFTPHDGERLIARTRTGADGAIPSGNGVAVHVLLRLHFVTGAPRYRERGEEILRLYHAEAARNPFGYTSYLQALELWAEGPVEVVVVGEARAAAPLWDAVAEPYLPHRVLVASVPGEADTLAPARERRPVDGRPTAYVCRHFTCSAPVHEPAALGALLAESTGA